MKMFLHYCLLFIFFFVSCKQNIDNSVVEEPEEEPMEESDTFIRGADLSYLNEMLDCGAEYFNQDGIRQDPYRIFQEAGTDLVRVRLWHDPSWTNYSDFDDVKQTITRAKAEQMQVLLDFHYSDDWADPHKQHIPAAWLPVVNNYSALGDSIYNYTFGVLKRLNMEGLLPEFVQVGNEINIEILQDPNDTSSQINWERNGFLLNKGLQAVQDAEAMFEEEITTLLHIAQPENALWWFEEAQQNDLTAFDWIGISYYPLWSDVALHDLPEAIHTLVSTYGKPLMVVETAYPYTLNNQDDANNILGQDAAVAGFPISEQGQYEYLKTLEEKIIEGGGIGLVYWEPAWVSTSCSTRWGLGSHWDNATLFDENNQANLAMRYYETK